MLYVRELEKPACVWCEHALPGKGCGVYETRWEVCRTFKCSWLRDDNFPDAWRPDKSGFIVRGYELRDGQRRPYVRVTRPDGSQTHVPG